MSEWLKQIEDWRWWSRCIKEGAERECPAERVAHEQVVKLARALTLARREGNSLVGHVACCKDAIEHWKAADAEAERILLEVAGEEKTTMPFGESLRRFTRGEKEP